MIKRKTSPVGQILPGDGKCGESQKDASGLQHASIDHAHGRAEESSDEQGGCEHEAGDEYVFVCMRLLVHGYNV